MNERIRQLAEQAGPLQEVLSEIHGGTPGRYVKNKALLDFQLEKFAELIVRECIEVFSKDMPDPMSPDYQLGTLNEVVNRVCNVAEHFGVEQ